MRKLIQFICMHRLTVVISFFWLLSWVPEIDRRLFDGGDVRLRPDVVVEICYIASLMVLAAAVDKCRADIGGRETQDREGKPGSPSS